MTDKTEAPELKPCPCCGVELAGGPRDNSDNAGNFFYYHPNDGCVLSMFGVWPHNIRSWNTRADQVAEVKPLPRNESRLPWELDWLFIDMLHKCACSIEDGSATHVAVEQIALDVERHINSQITTRPASQVRQEGYDAGYERAIEDVVERLHGFTWDDADFLAELVGNIRALSKEQGE